MQLPSPAFDHGGRIPVQYTGEGRDRSPLLRGDDPTEPAADLVGIYERPS